MFKMTDRYKLALQTLETTELYGSSKKLKEITKNGEIVSSLEVVEVVLVQYNLVDNTILWPINIMLIC